MPDDFLQKIAAEKRQMLKEKEAYYATLKKNMGGREQTPYGVFKKAIAKPGQLNLIAEVKKASPSAGLIREDFEAVKIAKTYCSNGAAALSVLTEEKYFLGKPMYLKKVSDACDVPVLMKDFIVHEHQIYEGAFNGASAVLLIVAMLDEMELKDLLAVTRHLGLDALVEVHEEMELQKAMRAGAEIIGVNNRDLRSLQVDLQRGLSMVPCIPRDKVTVIESGIKTHDDIKRVRDAGAHAVLIGETFMRADDIGSKVREIMHGAG